MSSFVDRNIGVVVRLRPVQGEGVGDGVGSSFSVRPTSITVHSRKPPPGSVLNNAAESHTLEGITVLTPSSTQEECYRVVASDIVEGAVAGGISGCILAYGQTGSGKTHSMLGADMGGQYAARGIMPRALSHAFACAEKALQERGLDSSARHTFRMSYVEVIENRVVDLLAKASAPPSGEGGEAMGEGGAGDNITTPLSAAAERVAVKGGGEYHTNLSVQEDKAGRTYIPGLHMPRVKSEEEALHLLLEGNAQRALSQHALNKASTRAHAVLTLYIEQQIPETPAPPQAAAAAAAASYQHQQHPPVPQPLSASAPLPNSPTRAPPIRTLTVTSKLHLVDLAGSERVRKTESEGKTLREANFINKSLSALEAVVVALSDAAAAAAATAAAAAGGSSTSPGGSGASATGHSPLTTTTDPHGEHIPYRSSRLTHLLKGALGGGPGTTRLLSTLWPEDEHAEECVATLRFSGRMMNLKTRAVREMVKGSGGGGGGGKGGGGWDAVEREAILTAHAGEVALLRRELALHDVLAGRGRGVTTSHAPLSQGEQGVIADLVDAFIEAGEGSPGLVAGGKLSTIRHIDAALNLMRREVWRARERLEDGGGRRSGSGSGGGGGGGGDAMRDTLAPAAAAQRSGSGSGDGGKAPGIAVSSPPPLHSQPQPYQQQYPLDNGGSSGGGRLAGGKVVSSPSPKPTSPPSSPKHQVGIYPPQPPPQAFQQQQQQQLQQQYAASGPPPPPPPSHFMDTSATTAGKETMSHAERDLEAWRETAPEYKKFVESRQAVRDAKGKYTAAATAVNEAKREIDALMAAGIPKLMAMPPPLPPPPPPPPPRPPRVRKTPPPPPPPPAAVTAPAQKPPSSRPPTATTATGEGAAKPPSSRPTTATTAAAAASKPSSRPPSANAADAAGVAASKASSRPPSANTAGAGAAASKPSSRPPTANAAGVGAGGGAGAGAGTASKPPSRPPTASAAPAPSSTPTAAAEGGEGEKVAAPVPEGEAPAVPEGESAPGVMPPAVEGEKKEGEVEGAAVATGAEEGGAGAAVVAPEGGVEGVEALAVGLAPSSEEATPAAAAPSGDAPAAEATGGAAGGADAAATLPHPEEHKSDGSGGGVQEKGKEEEAASMAAAAQAREAEEAELAARAAAAAFAEAEAAEDAAEAAAVAAEAAEAEAAAAAYAATQAAAAREVEAVTLHNAGVEEATRKLVEAKARYKAKYEEAVALKDEVEYLTEVTEALGKASAAAFHRHLEEEKAMGRGRGGVVGVGGP